MTRPSVRGVLVTVCIFGLVPALVGVGAADGGGEEPTAITEQPLVIDGITDAIFGDGGDDEDAGGGVFEMIFGDDEPTFDGYPDGFSEEGIEDFDRALGTESTHYNAESLTMTGAIDTPEGTFSVTMWVSGEDERVVMESETPDDDVAVQYVAEDTRYTALDGDYSQQDDPFDREQAYGVSEFLEPLTEADLTESEIDGDTVIYTATDSDMELAVRDTGELEYVQAELDDEVIELTFENYGETTVTEPDWVDGVDKQAERDETTVADRSDVPAEPPEDREPITIAPDEPGEVEIEVDGEGVMEVPPGERRVVTVAPDDDQVATVTTPTERYEKRLAAGQEYQVRVAAAGDSQADRIGDNEAELREERDRLTERLEWVKEEIDRIESGDGGSDHSDDIEELETEIDRNQDAIDQLADRLEEIDADEQDRNIDQEIDELEEQLGDRQERVTTLRERLEDTSDEERRERLQTWHDDVIDEIERIEDRIDRLEAGETDQEDERTQIRERIDRHEERIEDATDRIEHLEQEQDRSLDDETAELEAHRDEIEERIEEVEDRLDRVSD